MMRTLTQLTGCLLGGLLMLTPPAHAQNLQLGKTLYASGLARPVDIAHAPGDARMFVVEKAGRLRIVEPGGTVVTTPFLDIVARVMSTGNEQGLLGVAFDPNYATNGYFYVNYINRNSDTRISRFTRGATPDAADPASEVILLTIDQPYSNHNGGCLKFGPDGYLYIGMGDGGSGGDPGNRAQNMTELLGKMLRIDVDTTMGALPYGIPPSNPFATTGGTERAEIWGWGLRNPWRFSFDRQTGDLWIADVGQNAWEEVDVVPATMSSTVRNFGWRCYEGTHAYNTVGCQGATNYLPPIFEYSHSQGQSITGGFVYRGSMYPALTGRYVFTDYVSGSFWVTEPLTGPSYVTNLNATMTQGDVVSFGEDAAGEVYFATLSGGKIYRLTGTDPTGLSPEAAAGGLSVVPNPATGRCYITLPAGASGPVTLVSLVTGQTLRRLETGASGTATVDLRGLTPGLYAVRATAGDRPLTARLVVE